MSKEINKDERKVIEEIESICGASIRRINMEGYTTVENLFNYNSEGSIIMLGFDLKKMGLDDNKIALLGESVAKLKNLERFLINCPEGKGVPDWLKNLNYIKALILTNSQLPSIPDYIKDFINLKILNLTGNRIITLPDWLPTLNQLKELTLNQKVQTLELTSSNMEILRALQEKGVKTFDPTYNLHINFGVPIEQIKIIQKIGWIKDDLNRVFSEKNNC